MHKSVIISIVYLPTTPAFSHPSFPKEGNGNTTDWLNCHQILRRTLLLREERERYTTGNKGILPAILFLFQFLQRIHFLFFKELVDAAKMFRHFLIAKLIHL